MLRKWRLRRAELALANAKHDRDKLGWAGKPSQRAYRNRRIAKLNARVERLRSDNPEATA